jgi:exo-beta-1,3-glucanase (GH17 family)
MRAVSLTVSILFAGLMAVALWIVFDRPVPVEPSWSEPVRSVSFAPFRRGQSPLTKVYPTPQQIDEDLRSLVGRAGGIRTYTAREGMQVVPELAARYGLKVLFSAWLGNEKDVDDLEINALIKAANAHPNEIDRVIVGNEVLLRRDLKPGELIAAIRKVKAAVKQPVSYADVWAFYLKYPEVGREVDFITIHILPFWEDEPVAIDHVEEHIVRIVERIRRTFPGKPILIGEAGWPSLGRDRGPAVVSTVNEARFVRQMANIARKYDFDYNIVEAFDQPWKAKLENTVGAAWGVLDVDRKPKFDMSGPVVEVPDWRLRAAIAVVVGALAGLLGGRRVAGMANQLAFALLAQVLAWLAVTTAFHVEAVSFRWWQEIWAVFRVGLAWALSIAVLDRASLYLADPDGAASSGVVAFGRPLRPKADRWRGHLLMTVSGAYAVAWTLLLLVDGRYRDIPEIDFSVPAVGISLLLVVRLWVALRRAGSVLSALSADGLFAERPVPVIGWFAGGLLASAVAALASEGIAVIGEDFTRDHPTLGEQIPLIANAMVSNREMILWAAMLVVMAVPYLAGLASRRLGQT